MDLKVNSNIIVVFDLDDTLYNELDYLKSAYIAIAQHLEPITWKALYVSMFSMYRCQLNVFEHIAKTYKVDSKTLMELYRNHSPDIQLFDGVMDVLNAIKGNEGRIGIITDGRSSTQRAKIKSLELTDLVDTVVISEDIGSEKPSLANYKAIENEFKGFSCAYIADNLKKDFVTPNKLGWQTIGLIDNGKNIHCESYQHMSIEKRPQDFIFSFRDLTIV